MEIRLVLRLDFISKMDQICFFFTNRHVVIDPNDQSKNPDKLSIRVHTDSQNLKQNTNIPLNLYTDDGKPRWKEIDPRVDIIALKLPNLFDKFVIFPFEKSHFPPSDIIIQPGESMLVLGYPLGFHDQYHNFPIMRNASLASAYPVPFNNNPFFLIDANLHQGMSGGPVITKPASSYRTTGGTAMLAGSKWFFMGIHSHTWPHRGKLGNPLSLNAVWFPNLIDRLTKL